jgi:hypothetical protein
MGSHTIAGWIAHVAFWCLLVSGVASESLGRRAAATFVLLWLAGLFGLPYVNWYGEAFFAPYVALLDVVLVLMIYKGDVPIH